MAKVYSDDVYETIKDEFKQVQSCVGMYIGSKGEKGAIHLFKELFNNALDECGNEGSPANHIDVLIDEKINLLACEDNGRGIPFDKLIEVTTEKHSGTKFGRKYNKRSTGCNGVGMVVTNALASHFSVTSYRTKDSSGDEKWDGYEKNITYTNCELNDHKPVKQSGKKKHGLSVEYIPNPEYLGKVHIQADSVLDWLRHISYVLPEGVTVSFVNMDTAKNEVKYVREFKPEGLAANVLYNAQEPEFDPITITAENDLIELSFAFSYDKTIEESIDSYCNFAYTPDQGYHVVTAKRAIAEYFVKTARQLDPDSKYEVTQVDCRKGLVLAVNCFYAHVELGGQHKSSVESAEIESDMKDLVKDKLASFFALNNALLNKIIGYLRNVAKIRLEVLKMKGVKPPKPLSMHDEAAIKGYFPLRDRNHKGYCELFIAEGDSAAGAIKIARNPEYQAVFASRGVLANCINMSYSDMMKNDVLLNIIKILGCGIGTQFNIQNLRWNKIIILNDADADGGFIKSLNCTFFARAMPGLIEEGRLYAGVPPLYIIDEKSAKKYKIKKDFIFDKHEYYSIIDNIIASNIELGIKADNGSDDKYVILNKTEILEWLLKIHEYANKLKDLHDRTSCDTTILEHACWAIIHYPKYMDPNSKDSINMKKYFKKYFPEMDYDPIACSLNGSHNKKYYSLIIDDIFKVMAQDLIEELEDEAALIVTYRNKNDGSDFKSVTIGEFIAAVKGVYSLNIEQRFKGLGEIESELLFYTTLNPKVRHLIRLTMDDRDAALDTFNKLHGSNTSEFRRQLLLTATISDDDIDN